MKKIICLIIATVIILSFTACHSAEKDLSSSFKETTVNTEVTEKISSTGITDNAPVSNDETIIITAGEKQFEITKADFESKIPTDIATQIVEMISMDFGVEDYDGWEQDGQQIFSDVRRCTLLVTDYMKLKSIFNFDVDQYFFDEFLEDNGVKDEIDVWMPEFTFSLEEYNSYLIDTFGPDVRQLTVNDFETVKSANEKGIPFSRPMNDEEYICFYTGVDDIIIAQCVAIGVSAQGEYIVNIEKSESDYIVKTVGRFDLDELPDNLEDYQNVVKDNIQYNMDENLQTKTYRFGCTEEGDIYLKSVEKAYLNN